MDSQNIPPSKIITNPSIITIGTFDGVHLGHQVILKKLVSFAKQEKLQAVLLTFFPHPRMVLQKESNLKLINTIEERKQLLQKIGIEKIVVKPFTKEFSRLTALDFVRDVLVNQLNIKTMIIGYDHRFGRNREATIDDLKTFGKTFHFEVIEIDAQLVEEVTVSSTKIRKALENGNITKANQFLGYPFMISGQVVKGKKIGKTLGFPTANIEVKEDYKLIPKNGVYIVQATILNQKFYGITNIGTNPTFGGNKKTIETHFLDFNDNLYDSIIQIKFIKRIRDEKHFKSIDELKKAIQKDENYARKYITHNL